MSERVVNSSGFELDGRFRQIPAYVDTLHQSPRWSRYVPEGVDPEKWRTIIHADSDGLDQARLMLNLTRAFLAQDTDNTAGLSEEDVSLLMKAMAAQNWGKTDSDEYASTDISYEFITQDDIAQRIKRFHEVYQELVPEADVKERFIVERTIYDHTSRLGKVFDAVRRLSCLRTGMIAYNELKLHPDDPAYSNLGALSLGVLGNQLIPLISYAEDFAPVRKALDASSDYIDEVFNNAALRHSPLISNQQSIDSIEHAQMIWERSSQGEAGKSTRVNVNHDTIFSEGSAFERRFVNDKNKLKNMIDGLRSIGMRVVLTSGSFDLLHVGHAAYLEKAAEFGDILVVGVDSDNKIRERKGESRPIVHEEERVRLLSHLRGVGIITLKEPNEARWALIKLVHPDILVVTAETYEPHEIRELEEKYCGRVVVLEPQATTSTGAQIRKIEIGAAQQDGSRRSSKLGGSIMDILASQQDDQAKIAAIQEVIFDGTNS